MWSTRKRNSGLRLGHDKRDIPAFDTVALNSNLGSPRRNYFSIITTDINVLHFGSITSKRLLKLHHWWLKNKERKVDFRFVERKFLAAINLTGSAEGALVPVLLRITHWTNSLDQVSPPGLFACTVAVMSSVADMSSDVIGFTEPIISCVLSNNTQHKTGN